jgi:hypothetical protein
MIRARSLSAMGMPAAAASDLDAATAIAGSIADPGFRDETLAEIASTTGQILGTSDPSRALAALTSALDFQAIRGNQFRTAALLLLRGRAYNRGGDRVRAEADWSRGIHFLEDSRLAVRDEQLRIARTASMWDLFDELIDSQRDRPSLALQTVERTHARELLDSMAPRTSFAGFRPTTSFSWLPDGSAALVYASVANRLLIWTVTAQSVSLSERSVSSPALRDMIETAVRGAQKGAEPSPALSAMLLPDGLDLGLTRNIIVIPDGPIHQVPFGLLRGGPRGTRLLDAAVITVAPSLAVLRALMQRPGWSRPAAGLFIGVGDAQVAEGLPALPGVAVELRAIERLYPSGQVLLGRQAVIDGVLAKLHGADLLHFAGHAVSDAVHPAQSRLVLAPGSRPLRSEDIASARMRPGGLVVLGACSTAAGQTFPGEGPLNLARPFLIAGASSVVATLWPVGDADASRFLIEFHTLVSRGVSPALALATVQRRAPHSSQSNWAAFVLIGRA